MKKTPFKEEEWHGDYATHGGTAGKPKEELPTEEEMFWEAIETIDPGRFEKEAALDVLENHPNTAIDIMGSIYKISIYRDLRVRHGGIRLQYDDLDLPLNPITKKLMPKKTAYDYLKKFIKWIASLFTKKEMKIYDIKLK